MVDWFWDLHWFWKCLIIYCLILCVALVWGAMMELSSKS